MKTISAILSVLGVCILGSAGYAQTYRCELNDWSGGLTESVSIQTLGNAYDADLTLQRVRQYYGSQSTQWITTNLIRNRNFLTFRYYNEVTIHNIPHPQRVSLRVYIDGSQRCSILSSVHNYIDIQAAGTWR
jgi:hypothetical protein